jgi:hypothetical protein
MSMMSAPPEHAAWAFYGGFFCHVCYTKEAQRGMHTFLFIIRMNTEQTNETQKVYGYLNMIPNQ